MQWIDLYQPKKAAEMKENFIKQVLSTDFYSPMFWESINYQIYLIKGLFIALPFSSHVYSPKSFLYRWLKN